MTFAIAGFGADYLVPRAAISMIFGAGSISAGSQPFVCLLVGMKTSAGTMNADVDVLQVFQKSDADTYAGPGSQLARMAYKALLYTGVQLFIAAVAEPTGNKSTWTLVFSGTATAGGQVGVRIGGQTVTVGISNGDTAATVGANVVAAVNAFDNGRLPFTTAGTTTVTGTCQNKGLQGNDWIIALDRTLFPTGLTATLTGSATIDSNADRVYSGVASGTGTENVTNILTKLGGMRFARIGAAQYDTGTNAPLWVSFLTTQSGPMVLMIDQLSLGYNGVYSTAQTLAKNTYNDVLAQVVWSRYNEAHPAEIAASAAAKRSVVEGTNPLYPYNTESVLLGIPAQFVPADLPLDSEKNTALQNGVTPCTSAGTTTVMVRPITSHCLYNALADRRTLDVGDVNVPERFVYDMLGDWAAFQLANPVASDNPPPEENDLDQGLGTPAMWDRQVYAQLSAYNKKNWIRAPLATDTASYFDEPSERIMDSVNMQPLRLAWQLGAQVLQTTNA